MKFAKTSGMDGGPLACVWACVCIICNCLSTLTSAQATLNNMVGQNVALGA